MTASRYTSIHGLEDLILEESFVLEVVVTHRHVRLELDAVLAEPHPDYEAPKPGEQHCYRKATLRFAEVVSIDWSRMILQPAIDATGQRDFGGFDEFTVEGTTYNLEGDWGRIEVEAARRPEIDLVRAT